MLVFIRQFSRTLTIVAALCVLLTAPTFAQAGPEVFDSLTEEQIIEIMKAEGYAVELEPGDADSDPDVLWKLDGSKCLIFTYDKGHAIQFYVGFTDTDATLRKVNEWNQTKRFSRSFLDDEDDPCLELDLDLAGGITKDRLLDFFKTCKVSFSQWHKQVVGD